jgi:hypothetical protein
VTTLIRHILIQLVVISIVVLSGCGDDENSVDPGERLCRGMSGFAARISGTPEPVEMCVSDGNTIVIYTPLGGGNPAGKYEITSSYTGDLTIEISTLLYVHSKTPQLLNVTSDRGQAEFDPDGFWFFYREIKDGDYDFSSAVVSGTATVTFNDPSVVVVTFANLEISLTDTATSSTDAGTRRLSEGYINALSD